MREHYQQNFRESVSAPTSSFAKKQLEKMGWSEGTGLGKKRDGMKTHIRVKKRKDNVGIGGSDKPEIEAVLGDSEWWKDSLGSTLARLGSKKKKKKDKKDKKKGKKDKESGKRFTDEELFAATGGTRFGMRAGITTNLHKWSRTEKDEGEGSTPGDAASNIESLFTTQAARAATAESVAPTNKTKEKESKKRKAKEEFDDLSDERAEKKLKKDKKKRRKLEEEQLSTRNNSGTKVANETSDAKKIRKDKKKAKKSKKSKDE